MASLDEGTGYDRPIGTYDDQLVHVGPGTPMGELMRRYWHPIGLASDATRTPKQVRVLGEDLILFRDGDGQPGLVHERCCHRGSSLYYGKVEEQGIRCCYHGWLFDVKGRCLDQPCEIQGGLSRQKFRQPWYPVLERYDLIFAYMGPPDRKPALPRYECLENLKGDEVVVADGTSLGSGGPVIVDCNWLQHVENIVDPAHVPVLHQSHSGPQFSGIEEPIPDRISWERTALGIKYYGVRALSDDKQYIMEGEIVFPTLRVIPNPFFTPSEEQPLQGIDSIGWILPIDDTHFRIYTSSRFANAELAENLGKLFASVGPRREALGPEGRRQFPGDYEAQRSQGEITLHSEEHLVTSDRGVAMFRRLLREQIDVVARGGDPIGVHRDGESQLINLNSVRGHQPAR